MSISERLSNRPQALFLLLLVLCGAGVWYATRLPSAIFPTVTFPRVKVIAQGAEEPAAQMIPAVTRPLEEAILRVPGIERVVSTTTRGSVEIGAEFSWGTDMQLALQRVQAEIARARPDLPPETRIDAEWMNTAIFPILGYALTSDTLSPAALRELADFQLRPVLIQIPGVSQVQVQGGAVREFQVRLDPERLVARRLSATDVVDAIRKNNVLNSAGLVEANHELYLSLVTGKPAGIDELGRIAVASPKGGVAAPLSQLGEVVAADAVSYVRTTAERRPAVLVNIVRQPDASTLSIAAAGRRPSEAAPGAPAEGGALDDVLRPGRVHPAVRQRRPGRDPHRDRPRGHRPLPVSAGLSDHGDRGRDHPGDCRDRSPRARLRARPST